MDQVIINQGMWVLCFIIQVVQDLGAEVACHMVVLAKWLVENWPAFVEKVDARMNCTLGGEQPSDEIVDRVGPFVFEAVVALSVLAFISSEFRHQVKND